MHTGYKGPCENTEGCGYVEEGNKMAEKDECLLKTHKYFTNRSVDDEDNSIVSSVSEGTSVVSAGDDDESWGEWFNSIIGSNSSETSSPKRSEEADSLESPFPSRGESVLSSEDSIVSPTPLGNRSSIFSRDMGSDRNSDNRGNIVPGVVGNRTSNNSVRRAIDNRGNRAPRVVGNRGNRAIGVVGNREPEAIGNRDPVAIRNREPSVFSNRGNRDPVAIRNREPGVIRNRGNRVPVAIGNREPGVIGNRGNRSHVVDMRGERDMRAMRGDRDMRAMRGDRDMRGERDMRGDRDMRGEMGMRDMRGDRDMRGERGMRDMRGERGMRDMRGERDMRDMRDMRGERDMRDMRDMKGERDMRGMRGDIIERGDMVEGKQQLKANLYEMGNSNIRLDKRESDNRQKDMLGIERVKDKKDNIDIPKSFNIDRVGKEQVIAHNLINTLKDVDIKERNNFYNVLNGHYKKEDTGKLNNYLVKKDTNTLKGMQQFINMLSQECNKEQKPVIMELIIVKENPIKKSVKNKKKTKKKRVKKKTKKKPVSDCEKFKKYNSARDKFKKPKGPCSKFKQS